MKNVRFRIALLFPIAGTLLLCGCSGHYRVTEPSGGKEYYTRDVDRKREGAIEFKDARTGSKVVLQNSEVKSISSSDFEKGLKAAEKAK